MVYTPAWGAGALKSVQVRLLSRAHSPSRTKGRLAQLVERLIYTEKVTGSSPVSSTPQNIYKRRGSSGSRAQLWKSWGRQCKSAPRHKIRYCLRKNLAGLPRRSSAKRNVGGCGIVAITHPCQGWDGSSILLTRSVLHQKIPIK